MGKTRYGMPSLTLKQKEQKRVTFTVKENGVALDLTGATVFLGVKASKSDDQYASSKEDGSFNKAQEASGIISVLFTEDDLNLEPKTYVAELKLSFADGDNSIEKSADIALVVQGGGDQLEYASMVIEGFMA